MFRTKVSMCTTALTFAFSTEQLFCERQAPPSNSTPKQSARETAVSADCFRK